MRPIVIFITCLFPLFTMGQKLKGITFEPSIHAGKIIKHTPNFRPAIKGPTIGGEFNVIYQTNGRKQWHQFLNYPSVGMAISYFNMGDKEIFGSAVALMPNFTFKFLDQKFFHAHFRMGSGLAFINRPYDVIDNPTNNVIGARLNNITAFRLGFGWKLNPAWTLQTSLSYTHFSNGSSAKPNLGINIPAFNLGVRYSPHPLSPTDYRFHEDVPLMDKHISFNAYTAFAMLETAANGGPKYPAHVVSLSAGRLLKRANRLSLGFEYEYISSVYYFMKHVELYEKEKRLKRNAMRLTFFVADEILMGNFSFYFLAGTYLTQSFKQEYPIFTKLGMRYYLPITGRFKLHAGVYMKSHLITAEYIAYGIGVQF